MKGNTVKTGGGRTGYRNSSFWRTFDSIAQYVDHRKGWHKLGLVPGLLTLVGVRNILRKKNLFDTARRRRPPSRRSRRGTERFKTERTPDGTYNDLSDPAMGMRRARASAATSRSIAPGPRRRPVCCHPTRGSSAGELLTRHEFVAGDVGERDSPRRGCSS